MPKITKFLKPYIGLIILNIILVAVMCTSSLMLPEFMSKIISEGIKTEPVYEKTQSGEDIYIDLSDVQRTLSLLPKAKLQPGFLDMDPLVKLPKLIYKDAGYLVTTKNDDGKNVILLDFTIHRDSDGKIKTFEFEKYPDGTTITMKVPSKTGELIDMPVPKFLRTVDGKDTSEVKQGTLVLKDNGLPQIEMKQVSDLKAILKNGLIMIGFTVFITIASILNAFLSSKIGMYFSRDLRKELFRKITYFSNEEEGRFGTASLITRTTNDVTQIQNLSILALKMAVISPIYFIGGIVLALFKDYRMTIILLFSIPPILLVLGLVAKKIIPLFKRVQGKVDNLTLVARENVTGVRVIRAFSQEEREDERFEIKNKDLTRDNLTISRFMSFLFPFLQFLMSVTSIGIVGVVVYLINRDLKMNNSVDFTTLGNMMAVTQYIMYIMFSLLMVAMVFMMFPKASVSAGRINEVFKSKTKIVDKKTSNISNSNGKVEFKSVDFAFPNADEKILDNINVTFESGQTTAIIGSTGCGKSTIINLIPRLYDITGGQLVIGGSDIKDYSLKDLRKKIGFVPQKAFLFEGTIADNISYGSENASEEDIRMSAEIAQATEFISEKEDGFNSLIEEGGSNLSGGQKQRLSIARALCRKADIYIFDDCFSALDFKTDKKLRKALSEKVVNKTVIIVAQRIGTVMNADKIIVLKQGKVVGQGKHSDLLQSCEVYKEIAISQLSEEELNRKGGYNA